MNFCAFTYELMPPHETSNSSVDRHSQRTTVISRFESSYLLLIERNLHSISFQKIVLEILTATTVPKPILERDPWTDAIQRFSTSASIVSALALYPGLRRPFQASWFRLERSAPIWGKRSPRQCTAQSDMETRLLARSAWHDGCWLMLWRRQC